ncbi:LuxR C-terminal-related transcriptional regulator [Streptomyces sp. NPDC048416]|uniref:LuxR C-terminal-related transcriptional regulator n=1 Tax=Streptomyces sp. NPDC048416 TaxID=3365546 RepID=UPI00371D9F45
MTSEHQVNDQNGGVPGLSAAGLADAPGLRRMYAAALREGATTRGKLAVRSGLPRAEAETAFERLRTLHLLQPAEDGADTYRACAPQVAEVHTLEPLRHRLRDAQERIAGATVEFDALRAVYADAVGRAADDLNVEVLKAADVNVMLNKAAAECASDLMTAQPGGPRPVEVLAEALTRDSELLERGVRMRTIYQHSARYSPATEAYAERLTAAGAEIRTLNTLFPRLIVFDRRLAFVQADNGSGALRISQPDLITFMVGTFEAAWSSAIPYASAYETRKQKVIVSDMQRAIARLLLHEDKDAAIARQLGISERTCRQHIARLMSHLGARNRTHLGYLLATGTSGTPGLEESHHTAATLPKTTARRLTGPPPT